MFKTHLVIALFLSVAGFQTQQVQRLLYVALPGVGSDSDHGGVGVLVFDADNGYKVVKRITTWQPITPDEVVRGIAANAKTGRLFISTTKRLVALDLLSAVAICFAHLFKRSQFIVSAVRLSTIRHRCLIGSGLL